MRDFTFCGRPKQAMSKLSFSFSTWIWFLGIQLQEKNRDEDWKKANSLFKQLFRCRRCPLILLYLTTPTDPGLLVWVSYGQVATQNGWRLSVGRALNCRAGGRGFDYRGREYSQVLKITEKFTSLLVSDCVSLLSNTSCCFRKWSCSSCWARKKPQVLLVIFN